MVADSNFEMTLQWPLKQIFESSVAKLTNKYVTVTFFFEKLDLLGGIKSFSILSGKKISFRHSELQIANVSIFAQESAQPGSTSMNQFVGSISLTKK